MTDNVIEFRRFGDAIKRETILCVECESRAMRIITSDAGVGWMVECHNCGQELEGLEVVWDPGAT